MNGRRSAPIRLRSLSPGDAPLLARWTNDPEVGREIEQEPTTEADERDFILRVAGHATLIALGIELIEEARLVGWVDLTVDPALRSASFGIVVGERSYWGRGIGTEATRLALRHGFDHLGLERITLTVNVTNVFAIRAYERVGFEREAVHVNGARVGGCLVDEWLMAIERDVWLRGTHLIRANEAGTSPTSSHRG